MLILFKYGTFHIKQYCYRDHYRPKMSHVSNGKIEVSVAELAGSGSLLLLCKSTFNISAVIYVWVDFW